MIVDYSLFARNTAKKTNKHECTTDQELENDAAAMDRTLRLHSPDRSTFLRDRHLKQF